jgi:Ca2+-binding EF-hand superfamily protein
MSISSVAALGFGDTSQILAKMLSRLDNSPATANSTGSTTFGNTSPALSSVSDTETSNALTGIDQPLLSDQIVSLLVQSQQQSSAANPQSSGAVNDSSLAPASVGNTSVQQLFAAIDTNADGSISQSEMESFIEGNGGTQSQADALFSNLNQSGASGISESELASEAAQGHHVHHHHHQQGGGAESQGSSSLDLASELFSASDTNQDGTLSASELAIGNSAGVSSTSPTNSGQATSNLLAQIDSNGDGSVSSNELSTFMASLEQQINSDTATMSALVGRAAQAYSLAAHVPTGSNPVEPSYA